MVTARSDSNLIHGAEKLVQPELDPMVIDIASSPL